MKIKVITSIAVENNKKFLILKRAKHETMPGLWEFPGGKVNAGEILEESAKRELLEESGLKANRLEYRGYSERFSEDRNVNSGYHTLVHHFYVNEFDGKIRLSKEHTDFRWLTKEEILKMKVGEEICSDTLTFFTLKSSYSEKILRLVGIKDIWVKSFGNTGMRINLISAISDALKKLYVYERE